MWLGRESDGEVGHVVVWFGGRSSAGSRRLAGVGREGTRKRNPEKTTHLLGGAHRMNAAMQVTNTVEPLNGQCQQGDEVVEQHTVSAAVASAGADADADHESVARRGHE
jgi:hypothetical protein